MKKLKKEVPAIVERCGCTFLSMEVRQSGHYKVCLLLPTGRKCTFTMSASPKVIEHALDNFEHDIRRAIRNHDNA